MVPRQLVLDSDACILPNIRFTCAARLVNRQRGEVQQRLPSTTWPISCSIRKAKDHAAAAVHLLETDHLQEQLSALAWLREQKDVAKNRIAVAGTSFGGIETVLGAERGDYCAAVESAGAAQSWADAKEVQALMIHAVRSARAPIFFFQARRAFIRLLRRRGLGPDVFAFLDAHCPAKPK